jgi:hypothetical protein
MVSRWIIISGGMHPAWGEGGGVICIRFYHGVESQQIGQRHTLYVCTYMLRPN